MALARSSLLLVCHAIYEAFFIYLYQVIRSGYTHALGGDQIHLGTPSINYAYNEIKLLDMQKKIV